MHQSGKLVGDSIDNGISQTSETSAICWSTLLPEEMAGSAEETVDDDNDMVADKYWIFDEYDTKRMIPYHQM